MSDPIGFPGMPGDDDRALTLHPDELAGESVSAQELGGALEAARSLEAATEVPAIRPSADFTDRVMARLEAEPAPGPVGYLVPLRRAGLYGLLASLRQAWGLVGRGARPVAVRATALAYVLAVVIVGTSLTGLAAYGFAGAFGLLGPDRSAAPTQPLDTPSPRVQPTPTTEHEPTQDPPPEPSIMPSPSALESNEPEPTDDDRSTPRTTPRATEDGDDHETGTPEPTDTPKPSGTSKASPSPSESSSDD